MKFAVQYPIFQAGYPAELLTPASAAKVIQTVEAAGFDGLAFTDHPAPTRRWLDAGGHHSLDPLTALTFAAALTHRIRLLTYLLVLPYRNPLMTAKQIATTDVLSGGRLTLALGTGYLRPEFTALGIDFDERNELFDEAIDALTQMWATDSLDSTGRHFTAHGQATHPKPAQQPHPPLWVGGNSARARTRVATWGQGWAPLMMDPRMARTTRTPALTTAEELASAVQDLHRITLEAGRDPATLDIAVQGPHSQLPSRDDPAHTEIWLDTVGQLRDAGATWLLLEIPGTDTSQIIDDLHRIGETVLPNDH